MSDQTLGDLQERARIWIDKWIPDVTEPIAFQKVKEEFSEFFEMATLEETTDCIMALLSYAVVLGWDLGSAVDVKMTLNESRTWTKQPNGTLRWDRPKKG